MRDELMSIYYFSTRYRALVQRNNNERRDPSKKAMALFGSRYNCSALGIVTTLTANYGVKQSQFTKPISEPCASDHKESNEAFDRAIRGWLL